MDFEKLAIRQADEQLSKLNVLREHSVPAKGWVNLIRTTLGLTTRKLAKRMGLSPTRIVQIEQAELDHSITLKTLGKTAQAMNCQLVYALIPNTSLQDTLTQQAKLIAQKRMQAVSHTMKLEKQAVEDKKNRAQQEELIDSLLNGPSKKLWED